MEKFKEIKEVDSMQATIGITLIRPSEARFKESDDRKDSESADDV